MMLKKLFALTLAVCMLCASVVCLAEDTETEQSDFAMAYINGEAVMYSMVSGYADYIYESYGYNDDESEDQIRDLYQQAMNAAMGYVIMGQKAEEMGLKLLTEEEEAALKTAAGAEWAEYVEYYAGMLGGEGSSDEEQAAARVNAIAYLEANGCTEESLLEDAKNGAWYEKLSAAICSDVSVSDEDVEAAFLKQVEEDKSYFADNAMYYEFISAYYGYTPYYRPAGFRGIKQILLGVDEALLNSFNTLAEQYAEQNVADAALAEEEGAAAAEAGTAASVTLEDVNAAREAVLASVQSTVDEINARLAAGESFDALVEIYNTDPGMMTEPYKTEGYAVCSESVMYDSAFVTAAFSVNRIGEVSAPFAGNYGVYIVQYANDIPEGPVEFTDAIRQELLENTQASLESQAIDATVDAWLDEADVFICAEAYAYLPYPDSAEVQAAE